MVEFLYNHTMKALIRSYGITFLRFLAKRRLKIVKPLIVGVTGSVGKTSTKESIANVLSESFVLKRSQKNYNTEVGAILTVLDQKTAYSSSYAWFWLFLKACLNSFKSPKHYDALVMEMAVDKPGDMDEILKVFVPDIMVFLNVKDVHVGEGQFKTRQEVYEEKSKAVVAVPKTGWAVLNVDDPLVKQLCGHIPASCLTIGINEPADIRAQNIETTKEGLSFEIVYGQQIKHVLMPHVLGDCHVNTALAAAAVGFIQALPWSSIERALKEYHLPPGRMNKIAGVEGSLIIDSSYNASPSSMEAALQVLSRFSGRKIAALGNMNELGELSEGAHLKLGKQAAKVADMVIAVGAHAKEIAEGAKRGGLSSSLIYTFNSSLKAGEFLRPLLTSKDVVLAKGSQNGVRMEHLVKACMKYPKDARKKLVRQEAYWMTQS